MTNATSPVPAIQTSPEDLERRALAQLAGTRGEGFAEVLDKGREPPDAQKKTEVPSSLKSCDFCRALQERREIVIETEHFFAKLDAFPINTGHALMIPKRHVPDFFGLNIKEWEDLPCIMRRTKMVLDETLHPDGYNISINCGEAAGQTVFHCHIHLIPRYAGDVENPRGGIRNFKKPLVQYRISSRL